ncbi:MAG: hypothetical protein P8020_18950 [Acidobacteriota bacterium]
MKRSLFPTFAVSFALFTLAVAQDIHWTDVEGGLVQTSVEYNYVWGVNQRGEIYRRLVSGGTWERIPGGLVNVSATGNGWVWGVNGKGEVFKCAKPCDGGAWQLVSGRMSQVSGGPQYVWAIQQPGDRIYKRPVDGSGDWRQVPGGLREVSASAAGMVWGVNGAGEIWRCAKPCQGGTAWQRVNGALSYVSANDREVWGVNGARQVWYRPADLSVDWKQAPGNLVQLSAGSYAIWGVDASGAIYTASRRSSPGVSKAEDDYAANFRRNLSSPVSAADLEKIMQWIGSETSAQVVDYCYRNTWPRGGGVPMPLNTWTQAPGGLSQVCATGRDAIWGVNGNQEVVTARRPMDGSGDASVHWTRVEGSLVQVSADNDYVWGLDAQDNIFRRPSAGGAWQKIPGGLVDISATGGAVWGVNRAGEVFRCTKPCDSGAWKIQSGRMSQVSGGLRYVWAIQQPGDKIFKRPVDGAGDWREVPGGLVQVSASASSTVWGVNRAGEIWRCAKPCEGGVAWQRVAGELSQLSASDREVWGVNSAGQIWHLPTDPCGPGQEESNGLCYPACPAGQYGDGPVCWQQCPTASQVAITGQNVRLDCGVGCARNTDACASVLLNMVKAPINIAENILTMGGASAATEGAAAASKGITTLALSSTPKWASLLKAVKLAEGIAKKGDSVLAVFDKVGDLQAELDRWNHDASAHFSDFTSPRIERMIDQQFPDADDRDYIKQKYALYHFNSLLEEDGWRLGKVISGYASNEPTGIVALIDAFVQPMCRTEANPFPHVTILPKDQRTPDPSISATPR